MGSITCKSTPDALRFLRQMVMNSLLTAVVAAFFFAFPLQARVRRGNLVVSVASNRGDYVVIGAESRASRLNRKFVDDRSCKVSLAEDQRFGFLSLGYP